MSACGTDRLDLSTVWHCVCHALNFLSVHSISELVPLLVPLSVSVLLQAPWAVQLLSQALLRWPDSSRRVRAVLPELGHL